MSKTDSAVMVYSMSPDSPDPLEIIESVDNESSFGHVVKTTAYEKSLNEEKISNINTSQFRVKTELTNNKSQNNNNGKNLALLKEPTDKSPLCKRRKIDQSANEASTSHTHQIQSSQMKGPGTIPYPAPLPKLTPQLEQLLATIGVFEGAKSFIYFWSIELENLTNGRPTKRDYQNYSRTIVDTYPALKGGTNACGIVKSQLSICIRNRRSNLKKKIGQTTKQKIKSQTSSATFIVSDVFQSTETDIEAALKELNKNKNTDDTAHVRRLMQETLAIRRSWIEDEANEISAIIDKYPQLANYNLILFEFSTLNKVSVDIIFQNMDSMIKKLASFFSIDEIITEESKCSIITKLHDHFINKKLKNSSTQLFTIKKAMSSTENLITSKDDSPRVVLYTAEAGIAAAFVVADENVRIKVPDPTVYKTIICLLASYYVWDTKYPPAYSNTMEYIDHEVLGTSLNKNNIVEKFICKRDYELNKSRTAGDK